MKIKIALFFYFLIGLLFLHFFQYYVVTDIVPYVTIAQKYLQGDIINAVNGIWGVLVSWLLVPFLFIGIKSIIAFKLLNLLIGGLTLFGIWLFGKKFNINKTIESIFLISLTLFAFLITSIVFKFLILSNFFKL